MKAPVPALLLAFLLTAAAAPAQVTLFYRSNALGFALEPLPRFDPAEPYLLRIERREELEVRTLYGSGKELERREILPLQERVYARGVLSEERLWDARGRLSTEFAYRDSVLERRSEYRYGPAGLLGAESFDAKGALLSRDSFELGQRGELRRVRREEPAGPGGQQLALVSVGGRRYEERLTGGGRLLLDRFDAFGRLSLREDWRDWKLAETRTFMYDGSGGYPAAEERSELASGLHTVLRYDGQGRETGRVVGQGGKILEEWSLDYDPAGNLSRTVRQSSLGRQEWTREHDEAGRLRREEYRLRGQLESVVRYPEEGTRLEELYRAGSLFLIVTFRSGVRVREEFVQDGAVVRTRDFSGVP